MGFCDLPLADKMCAVGDAVDFASNPIKAVGDWMAKSVGELAAAAADLAAEAVNRTTKVDLRAGWFVDNYETLLPIGLIILVGTFCAQLIRSPSNAMDRPLPRHSPAPCRASCSPSAPSL